MGIRGERERADILRYPKGNSHLVSYKEENGSNDRRIMQ